MRICLKTNVVEWLQFFSNNSLETPEVAILYSLVTGRGELIMFGRLQKDVAMMRNQAAANENDLVTNALYFSTPPCEIVRNILFMKICLKTSIYQSNVFLPSFDVTYVPVGKAKPN